MFPLCKCDSYDNEAWEKAEQLGSPNRFRMCQKVGWWSTICYPMLPGYDYSKGDNDNYFGCPVDTRACTKLDNNA